MPKRTFKGSKKKAKKAGRGFLKRSASVKKSRRRKKRAKISS